MEISIAAHVDARGLVCPMPTLRLGQAIRKVEVGQIVEFVSDDPGSAQNLAAWVRNTGHQLVAHSTLGQTERYHLRRVK